MRLTLPGWQRGKGLVWALLCSTLLSQTIVEAAEESTLFRFTGFEGALSLARSQNEVEQGVEGFDSSSSRLTEDQQELSFLTHSYVYHPNLLSIDLGAGLLLTQRELESGGEKTESEGEFQSLTAQLRFLEKKPYPFTLYYHRFNPSTQVSGSERFVSKNVKYGVNASLLEPILPFSVNMEAFRQTNQGTGATQIVDTTNEQVFLRAYRSLSQDGHIQFSYHNNRQISESGVVGREIQRTDRESESTSLDSTTRYGERKQFKLINLLSYFTQDNLPQREEFRWSPNLEWEHSSMTTSFYRFDYNESEINAIQSTGRSGGIGVRTSLTDKLTLNGEVHASDAKTLGLESRGKGVSGGVSYVLPLTIGRLNLGFGTGYDLNEQNATAAVVSQQDERLRHDGVERLQLYHPFVESISNIAVERDGVIVFPSVAEGVDYTVETEGPLTFITVVINSDPNQQKIQFGDTLIVDYTYKIGGTLVYSTFNHNYSAELLMFKYYTIYASYSDTQQELEEGYSNIPLNSMQYTRMGMRIDHPFYYDTFRLGAESIYEKQEEEISPYTRRTASAFAQVALTGVSRLRLSVRRVQQDNLKSQDVDILSRAVTFTTRPLSRSSLRLEYRDDEDTGGELLHRITQKLIQFQWRVRKLSISLDGAAVDERQGKVIRQSYSVSASLTRSF